MDHKDIKAIIQAHNQYYDTERLGQLDALTRAYDQRLLSGGQYGSWTAGRVTIEPATAKQYIESYMASLFPKAPAVVVEDNGRAEGKAKLVESVCNRFLYDKATVIEQAMRTAFIYPFSFLKLWITPEESVLDSVELRPIKCWDVVMDFEAETFEQSRYIGHRYWLPMLEAKTRFPGKKFKGTLKRDLFNKQVGTIYQQGVVQESDSDYCSYIEVYEIYDMLSDKVYFYSEQSNRGDCLIKTLNEIPFRDHANRPIPPLVPMYFDYNVIQPLRGSSHLARVFDQVLERANLRTEVANSVRRDSRQMFAKKGILDEESKAIYSQNKDGTIVEVDIGPGDSLNSFITPAPQIPLSSDFSLYDTWIERDLQAGSLLGAFTKGQATNVSATEIAALTQYTSTEIGKLARIRDTAIEYLCQVYVCILAFLLETETDESEDVKEVKTLDGSVQVIRAQDFVGRFKFGAADQANTPISSALKQQQLLSLMPLLMNLGVPKEPILEQMVRLFDLPVGFLEPASPAVTQAPDSVVTGLPPGAEPPLPVGGGEVASMIRSNAV